MKKIFRYLIRYSSNSVHDLGLIFFTNNCEKVYLVINHHKNKLIREKSLVQHDDNAIKNPDQGFSYKPLRKAKDKEKIIIYFKENKNNVSHNYSIKLVP